MKNYTNPQILVTVALKMQNNGFSTVFMTSPLWFLVHSFILTLRTYMPNCVKIGRLEPELWLKTLILTALTAADNGKQTQRRHSTGQPTI